MKTHAERAKDYLNAGPGHIRYHYLDEDIRDLSALLASVEAEGVKKGIAEAIFVTKAFPGGIEEIGRKRGVFDTPGYAIMRDVCGKLVGAFEELSRADRGTE